MLIYEVTYIDGDLEIIRPVVDDAIRHGLIQFTLEDGHVTIPLSAIKRIRSYEADG